MSVWQCMTLWEGFSEPFGHLAASFVSLKETKIFTNLAMLFLCKPYSGAAREFIFNPFHNSQAIYMYSDCSLLIVISCLARIQQLLSVHLLLKVAKCQQTAGCRKIFSLKWIRSRNFCSCFVLKVLCSDLNIRLWCCSSWRYSQSNLKMENLIPSSQLIDWRNFI